MGAHEAKGAFQEDASLDSVVTEAERRTHVRRDALVSALLQDRGVLRLISAPHGFGKSMLAWEYATRLFQGKRIMWVDARQPAFLKELDAGTFASFTKQTCAPDLLVIDALPFLDEERTRVLSQRIDAMLYRGVEVVATCVPSNDSLRSVQPDRILLRGSDLLVAERESALADAGPEGLDRRVHGQQAWHRAQRRLFGRAPAVYWGREEDVIGSCLRAFFSESLPADALSAAFAMLLLGEGAFEDLPALVGKVSPESMRLFADDYPLFQLDMVQGTFRAGEFPLPALRSAVDECPLAQRLLTGTYPVPERVLSMLMRRADVSRAQAVLASFCSDERCGTWLREHGWDLLDQGDIDLVETLFERCDRCGYDGGSVLDAIRAWTSGLQGSRKEADRFAQRVLRHGDPEAIEDPAEHFARVAAYLALLAFGRGGPLVFSKEVFSDGDCTSSPGEFLAAVVDSCTEVELARALSVDDAQRSAELEKSRTDPSDERVEALVTMFTQVSDRFYSSMFYQLALHVLGFVDSTRLRALQQDLGCDAVILARRRGLKRTSEALLVRDLWAGGYFGPLGHANDKRDAHLLEMASRTLKRFGSLAGYTVQVPWELGSMLDEGYDAQDGPGRSAGVLDGTPVIEVRLFGGFEVAMGGAAIPDSAWRKKARMLFIALVLNQGRDISRTELFEMLWPQLDRRRALGNFYTLWSNMQAVFGGDVRHFERNGEFCRINPHCVVSDVAEFEQLARSLLVEGRDTQALLDSYARLERLYRGGLLPAERDAPIVRRYRERYHAQFTDAMVAATMRALEARNPRVALWFARRAMESDPRREDVYNALIRAQVAAGQRCSAIRTYFKCREFLREELGLDPSLETQDLYEHLISVDPSLIELTPASFGNWNG